jgi:transcriptional regulator GlxA family with amidase domain
MQSWKNNHASIHAAPQQFGVLLFDNFSNHCLANMIEPLRAANDLLGFEAYRWTFLTLDGGPATSSSGLPVMAHQKLSDASGDGLILLPSYGYRQLANGAMDRALRAASRRFQTLIGLDTGAWLLAHAGVLDGHPATIHFEEFDAFSERFPDVNARRERWVIAPGRITASGAMTAFDLAQHMIGERHGQAVTLDIAALFMHGDLPRPQTPSTRDKYVTRALAEMQAALEHPVTIAELARRCGASTLCCTV